MATSQENDNNKKAEYINAHLSLIKDLGFTTRFEEGIMIWGWTDEEIPSDIYFLPIEINRKQTFRGFVINALQKQRNSMREIIFAPIRYNMPDLAEKLNELTFIQGRFPEIEKNVKISYVRIYYDQFNLLILQSTPNHGKILLNIDDLILPLSINQEIDEFGFPSLIEKMEF